MKTRNLLLVTVAAAGAVALLAAGRNVYAADTGFATIVTRIAERFNLNQSDVQKVFDDARAEKRSTMRKNLESRLTTAVSEGTITEAQKQAILTKFDQMPDKIAELRSEWETWMSTNNLTVEQLEKIGFGLWGRGFRHGFMMGWHHGIAN